MMTEGRISNRSKQFVWVRVPYGRGAHRILTFDAKAADAPQGPVGTVVTIDKPVRTRPEGGWTI